VDPVLDRVISRCLSRDPKDRPASAREVLLSLPGGDPLQAAVLAGETPSPEMVAAAAQVGDFKVSTAWACLSLALVGLLSITITSGRAIFRQAPLPKPPEALIDRARDVLMRLGYPEAAKGAAFGFGVDSDFIKDVRRQGSSEARAEAFRTKRPGPYLFYYRESREALASNGWLPAPPWAGVLQMGRVFYDDPPMVEPGMTRVTLDPSGHLVGFTAVPFAYSPADPGIQPPDWTQLLTEAGFDASTLTPSTSNWSVRVDADQRAAWDGPLTGQPDIPFHIEAASFRGRVVSFEMRGPWIKPPLSEPPKARLNKLGISVDAVRLAGSLTLVILTLGLFVSGGLLAWRNLRLGRGDRKGGFRIAVFSFTSLLAATLLHADHTTVPVVEYSLIVQLLSQAIAVGLVAWVFYIALEPSVRRRSPQGLISWSRLLTGRFRDPMVGRDILIGAVVGLILVLVNHVTDLRIMVVSTLSEPRHVAYYLFMGLPVGVGFSLGTLFLLHLVETVTRRAWLARLVLFVDVLIIGLGALDGPEKIVIASSLVVASVVTIVITRYGLLSSAMFLFTYNALTRVPLTLDPAAWYFGRSFAVLLFFAGLFIAAFHTSLGGKPALGRNLLDD
jgi:serine/threonine-protein kinase